ncbi:MAG TPA: DUF2848 domain-containing protein [Pirellulales bacterium]|nr:DUF2848 domain-containing protein [Pirellulales bacterium]
MNLPSTLSLTLDADGRRVPIEVAVRRLVNAGYVGRNQAAVRAHIAELAAEGIAPPASLPVLFPLAADNITTAERIEVLGEQTSGEVEFVLLVSRDDVLVGVGSDHTDRALERQSVGKSKQVCKNVVSPDVWRYRDVRDHWDELILRSWVHCPVTGREIIYQQGALAEILSADDLLQLVRSRLSDGQGEGLVIFSGTLPALGGKFIASDYFRGELHDPRTEKTLRCVYRPVVLQYLTGAETS